MEEGRLSISIRSQFDCGATWTQTVRACGVLQLSLSAAQQLSTSAAGEQPASSAGVSMVLQSVQRDASEFCFRCHPSERSYVDFCLCGVSSPLSPPPCLPPSLPLKKRFQVCDFRVIGYGHNVLRAVETSPFLGPHYALSLQT